MNEIATTDESERLELDQTSDEMRHQGRVGWGIALAVATLLTLLFPTQHYLAERYSARVLAGAPQGNWSGTPWTDFLILEIPVWYLWLAFSPLIIRISEKYPLTGGGRYRNLAVHLVAGTMVSAAHILTLSFYRMWVPIPLPPELSFDELAILTIVQYLLTMVTIYATIVAIHHAVAHYRESQARALHAVQLENRLATARLNVLKMQLQPHFLFNTLNTISSLTLSDPRAAQRMIVRLSDLLRRSLENLSIHEVPLSEEIDFLKRYAEIQQARFSDRLSLSYDIESGTERVLVPRLILQPLVENAVRHGVERTSSPVRVEVRSRLHGDALSLEVADDGPGISGNGSNPSMRIGLRNTEARLRQLYGPQQNLTVGGADGGGFVARITLPVRLAEPEPVVEALP